MLVRAVSDCGLSAPLWDSLILPVPLEWIMLTSYDVELPWQNRIDHELIFDAHVFLVQGINESASNGHGTATSTSLVSPSVSPRSRSLSLCHCPDFTHFSCTSPEMRNAVEHHPHGLVLMTPSFQHQRFGPSRLV